MKTRTMKNRSERKLRTVFAVCSVGWLLLFGLPTEGRADWPSFLGGAQRGAYRPEEQLNPPLQLLWAFSADGYVESSPAG